MSDAVDQRRVIVGERLDRDALQRIRQLRGELDVLLEPRPHDLLRVDAKCLGLLLPVSGRVAKFAPGGRHLLDEGVIVRAEGERTRRRALPGQSRRGFGRALRERGLGAVEGADQLAGLLTGSGLESFGGSGEAGVPTACGVCLSDQRRGELGELLGDHLLDSLQLRSRGVMRPDLIASGTRRGLECGQCTPLCDAKSRNLCTRRSVDLRRHLRARLDQAPGTGLQTR